MKAYQNLSLEDMSGEIWKPVVGYIDEYEVSNYGRIKSLERKVQVRGGGERTVREKIIMQTFKNQGKAKYLAFSCYSNNFMQKLRVARVTALAFVSNPDTIKCTDVIHKDFDLLNNYDNNLKWAKPSEKMLKALEIESEKFNYSIGVQ